MAIKRPGGDMESTEEAQQETDARERPEYLPQTKREGSGLGWTLAVGICLAAAIAGGAAIYVRTVADWHRAKEEKASQRAATRAAGMAAMAIEQEKYRQLRIAEIKAQREQAQQEWKALERGQLRCINGTIFRRIDGGWENLAGRSCQHP
ncbi:hypothetical protein [Xanthomonas sacchari]|uniref:hypothetical protein n=1 Tax=Xanthomonas sacchari TaxID=56458 RepID=UPI00225AD2CC|nr:hypothetical protein [Xanthomonas sacchari]